MAAFLDAASYLEPMGMGVDEAGDDIFAADIADRRALRHGDRSAGADRDDAIVGDDDIGIADHILPARHRHDGRAAQHDAAAGHIARQLDRQCEALRHRLGRARRSRQRLIDRQAAEGRSDRPGDGRALVGPVDEVGADPCQLASRHRRRVEIDGRRLAAIGRRDIDQIGLAERLDERAAAIRADPHILDRRRAGEILAQPMGQHAQQRLRIAPRQRHRGQAARAIEIEGVTFAAELRLARAHGMGDKPRCAAADGHVDDVGRARRIDLRRGAQPVILVRAQRHHALAIGGKDGLAIKGRELGQPARRAARRRDRPDMPAILGGPADIGDALAIG